MVYYMLGNPATAGTARVFVGETPLDCAKQALAALPRCEAVKGKFLTDFGEDKEDSLAWAVLRGEVKL